MTSFLFDSRPHGPAGWTLLRVLTGLLIARHGLSVLDSAGMRGMGEWLSNGIHLPAGLLLAYLAKGTEFFGGLLLALGLLTRPVALLLAFTMAVAVFGAHADDILGKGEVALVFGVLFLAFFGAGPGRWSLDHWLTTRRNLT